MSDNADFLQMHVDASLSKEEVERDTLQVDHGMERLKEGTEAASPEELRGEPIAAGDL